MIKKTVLDVLIKTGLNKKHISAVFYSNFQNVQSISGIEKYKIDAVPGWYHSLILFYSISIDVYQMTPNIPPLSLEMRRYIRLNRHLLYPGMWGYEDFEYFPIRIIRSLIENLESGTYRDVPDPTASFLKPKNWEKFK